MKILTAEFKAVLAGMRVMKPEKISVGVVGGHLTLASKHVRVNLTRLTGNCVTENPREIDFPKSSLFKGKEIEVTFEENSVRFANVRIASTPIDEYHFCGTDLSTTPQILGSASKCVPALEFIQKSVSWDLTRPHLNMLLIDEKNIVSTDGHRMHWVKHHRKKFTPCKIHGELNCIFINLKKLYGDSDTVRVAENQIEVSDNIWISSLGDRWNCNVDHDFPPYDQVIPKSHDFEWQAEIKVFDAALKQLDSKATPGQLVIRPIDKTTVEFTQKVNNFELCATVDIGKELKNPLSYNIGYLVDALSRRDKMQLIRWRFQGPLDPLVITDGDYSALVMPRRI